MFLSGPNLSLMHHSIRIYVMMRPLKKVMKSLFQWGPAEEIHIVKVKKIIYATTANAPYPFERCKRSLKSWRQEVIWQPSRRISLR